MSLESNIKLIQKSVGVTADGVWGPKTRSAVAKALGCADTPVDIQKTVGATPDGKIGPRTVSGIITRLKITVPEPVKAKYSWPTQAQIRSGNSIFGKRGAIPMKKIVPPYPLKYDGKVLSSISVNEKIADAVLEVLQKVLDHYGLEKIQKLKLDVYDGCYADRSTRSGSLPSMHAWAIALDFDAADNGNTVKAPKALFSKSDYDYWFQCWREVGATGGFDWNRDWMHVQFTAKV